MKKFLPLLAVGIMAVAMTGNADAARRFGGGASFGRPAPTQFAPANKGIQSPAQSTRPAAAPQQQKAAPAGAAPAAKPASPMRNMLMGAAAALGIAALAHYLGFGDGLASVLMMLLIAFAAVALFRMIFARKAQPRMGTAGAQTRVEMPSQPEPAPVRQAPAAFATESSRSGSVMDEFTRTDSAQTDVTPAGFDKDAFLSECRRNFGALQQAWCTGNVLQLSEFCTDDVFTELTHQLRERHGEKLQITIESLEAELYGIAQEQGEYLAAVHFTGNLDVTGGSESEREVVNEVWTLTRKVSGSEGWLLAGIRQI